MKKILGLLIFVGGVTFLFVVIGVMFGMVSFSEDGEGFRYVQVRTGKGNEKVQCYIDMPQEQKDRCITLQK